MSARYRDASALRRALEDRLKQQAADSGHDPMRLRRLVVFDRLAARLAADREGGWVLKGGAVMEFRLRDRARTTKDLDLATGLEQLDCDEVRDLLIDALSIDMDGDGFVFRVGRPTSLAADTEGYAGAVHVPRHARLDHQVGTRHHAQGRRLQR